MNAFTPRKARRNECIHCGGASPLAEARRGIAPEWVRRCMVQAKSELLSLCVCRVEAGAGPGPRHWSAPGPRACPPQKRHVTYKRVWGPGPVGPRHGTYTEEEPFAVASVLDGPDESTAPAGGRYLRNRTFRSTGAAQSASTYRTAYSDPVDGVVCNNEHRQVPCVV